MKGIYKLGVAAVVNLEVVGKVHAVAESVYSLHLTRRLLDLGNSTVVVSTESYLKCRCLACLHLPQPLVSG